MADDQLDTEATASDATSTTAANTDAIGPDATGTDTTHADAGGSDATTSGTSDIDARGTDANASGTNAGASAAGASDTTDIGSTASGPDGSDSTDNGSTASGPDGSDSTDTGSTASAPDGSDSPGQSASLQTPPSQQQPSQQQPDQQQPSQPQPDQQQPSQPQPNQQQPQPDDQQQPQRRSQPHQANAVPLQQRLNPAQQQIIDQLGSTERPTFRDDLRDHLRHELNESLLPIAEEVEDPPLFVSKRKLSMIHGCEARFIADQSADFEWNVPAARGTVAHKAIELLVARRGNPTPLDLVNDAMDRLEADERSIAKFLASLTEGERADLVGRVNDLIATFVETFPPLNRKWVPVAESRVRADLCGDKITLMGTVDLSLGRARGNEAGKVLIDLKTGRHQHGHVDDLRFYALLETLKLGVPPRLLVNYYLDAGEPRTEEVTEDLLWSTAKRVVDAVAKQVDLALGNREPTKSVSGMCRFCPALTNCDLGKNFLDERDLPVD